MKSVIRWFVYNPVAANLLMWVLLIGGLVSIPTILIEEFPTIDPGIVQVQVVYPGAAPEEVESGVCKRIEEAIDGVEGILKLDSTAYEGLCMVMAEIQQGTDQSRAADDIQARVNAITTLPVDAETPLVSEMSLTAIVINAALSGDISPRALKEIGEQIRDDIADLPEVSKVELLYAKDYEISVDVSEQVLRQYELTLDEISDSIAAGSQDVPGGTLKSASGEILLRTIGQAYDARDLEAIAVKTLADGSVVKLGEVASITDGFVDRDIYFDVDGAPSLMIKISRTGDENLLEIADSVKTYIEQRQDTLPEGVTFRVWKDESRDLVDRLTVLGRNAGGGLLLVLLVLSLFLQPRVAFWVAVGLPVAMVGTLLLFPAFDVSISSISIMAFILVLGILVDDAIVVGERVHSYETLGFDSKEAAIKGAQEVSTPVIFGVFTTMAAFMPLVQSSSGMSAFMQSLGITAIAALMLSIIESQMILPSHLAHRKPEKKTRTPGRWQRLQTKTESGLRDFAQQRYAPALRKALYWRYLTVAIAVSSVILTAAMFASGRAVFQFFPSVESDRVYATVVMPAGSSYSALQKEADKLKQSAELLRRELDGDKDDLEDSQIESVLVTIGGQLSRGTIDMSLGGSSAANYVEAVLQLKPYNERQSDRPSELARRWRELTPPIGDAVAVTFTADFFSFGAPIDIQLSGDNPDSLHAAADMVKDELRNFDGVADIVDSFRSGKQEIQFVLKDNAQNLGLNVGQLGQQIRHAFYGAESQRVQRNREDVRIMVRQLDTERSSIGALNNMRIQTPGGADVALGNVAELNLGRGFSSIKRLDGKRVISVTADVDRDIIEPERVLEAVGLKIVPEIKSQYPDVEYSLGGEAEENVTSFSDLVRYSMLALLLIYALLAVPLQSYTQPLIIMSVIPFGAVGAIIGHLVLGKPLVFFSLLGIVALSGVVINSCLVLVDTINRMRLDGSSPFDAIVEAGTQRFRPIVLTSLTTFVGLIPLISDPNPTTAMIIPMAVSLSFGVIFATLITLFLVPCLYLILVEAGASNPGLTNDSSPDNSAPSVVLTD